jgi:hypothetical protein
VRGGADLVRVAGLASLGWAVVGAEWVDAALFSLVLLGLVLPRLLSARPPLDLVYGAVLLFAAWSAVLDLYVAYDWLDVVVHAATCGLTAWLASRLLAACEAVPRPGPESSRAARAGAVLTTTALGTTLGLLWELGEWFGHTYLDRRIQVGYNDTIGDLTADALGALAAGLVVLRATRAARAVESAATGPREVSR